MANNKRHEQVPSTLEKLCNGCGKAPFCVCEARTGEDHCVWIAAVLGSVSSLQVVARGALDAELGGGYPRSG
jgi:hypothetical protein